MRNYIFIARPDHWFKNIFVIPGTLIAAVLTETPFSQFIWPLVLGLAAACLVASANYVINEWLDAPFDRFHPVKKNRPSVAGKMKASLIYTEYCLIAALGLAAAFLVSKPFFAVSVLFLLMGILYNVKPFRLKEKMYLDVLSESVNNPIRLMLGWFVVTGAVIPPSSLLLGYWMGGAFLMGIKRYAEYRFIGNAEVAGLYRRSFRFYTEESLLIASFFYGMCALFFLGIFLIKYRIELIISVPFLAYLFTWYLQIGMKVDSPAQNPENLYREKAFIAYAVLLGILMISLFFIEIPALNIFLNNIFN